MTSKKLLIFTLLCLAISATALRLGFWQLDRAVYHQNIIDQYHKNSVKPVRFSPAVIDLKSYDRVRFDGVWRDQMLLVDNQVRNGQVGYNILQLFELATKRYLWVDRGFIAISDRSVIPDVKPLTGESITGEYYYSAAWNNTTGRTESLLTSVWRLSNYNNEVLQSLIDGEVVKGVIRMAPSEDTQLLAQWPRVAVDPNKNRAYAAQWFLITTAVMLALGFFLWHNMRENNKELANGNGSGCAKMD